MKEGRLRSRASLALLVAASIWLVVLTGCGSGTQNSTSSMTGAVTTSISDPPTCAAQYSNVWVTITKVVAHISSDAGSNDSGWVTLVDLTSNPKQIDLLSLASTTCVLTQLGSTTGLPPGKYQQIRLILLANDATGATPSPNACGSGGFNCVVPNGGSPQTLNLSSEAKTGLKIPPGQIAGGGIDLMVGQSADINIDFDACRSILRQGNGRYRLKPTLHAGEVALNQNTLSGRVVDNTTTNPIPGAVVSLEQVVNNVDRVQMSALTASDGTFFFCPLPPGNYDVVVTGMTGTTTYNATVTLQVPVGTALGDIGLIPEGTGTTTPGTINGMVTSTTAANLATSTDVTLFALQQATAPGGSAVTVTIPLFAGSTAFPLATDGVAVCPAATAATDCANYTLLVPGSNPRAGTFNSAGTSYSTPSGNAAYSIEADATKSDGTADCSSPTVTITTDNATPANPLAVGPGGTVTAATITFTGCI